MAVLVAFATFAVAGTLLIILPGPDTAVVLRGILRGGRSGGMAAAAGVCCGLLVWLVLAVAGLSALLSASRVGYDALKIAGALYLAWLGIRLLVHRRGEQDAASGAGIEQASPRWSGAAGWYASGIATDLLNPKVGVLFITFLPQFVPQGEPVKVDILVFGALYTIGTVAWYALLLGFAERLDAWLRRPRPRRWLERITAVALIGFAIDLAIDAR